MPSLQPHACRRSDCHLRLYSLQAQRCYYEKLLAERSPSQQALSCLAAAAAQLYAEVRGSRG